jgi:hypothetical protein
MLPLYEVLYRTWSSVSHGEAALNRISGQSRGRVALNPIRSPVNLPQICNYAGFLTLDLGRHIVDGLVPHLQGAFRDYYIQHVKPKMDFIQRVKVEG